MSDAAKVAREWLHERSLSLDRTDDLAAMLDAYAAEQTAAEAAKHADCCVDREELAALRAKLQRLSVDCLSQGCKRAEYEQRCVEADEDLERQTAALRAIIKRQQEHMRDAVVVFGLENTKWDEIRICFEGDPLLAAPEAAP